MIAVCSIFRDSASEVEKLFTNRAGWAYPRDQLLHVCVEGDSTDGTYEELCRMKTDHRVIVGQYHTGGPRYPSIIHPDRLRNLARTSNACLEMALAERPDHIMWLDSDVTAHPNMLAQLLEAKKDVIAPLLLFERSVFFRDTWGYRSASGDFTNRPPYCVEYDRKQPFEVVSVGQPLMRLEVVNAGARFSDDEEIVGLCRSIRNLGFKIFCHQHAYVEHPRIGIDIPKIYEKNRP